MLDAFVDPPSPFAPLEEWGAFRDDMMAVIRQTPEIERYIREAEEAIERLTPLKASLISGTNERLSDEGRAATAARTRFPSWSRRASETEDQSHHHSAKEPSLWRQIGLRQRWPSLARSLT
jgi:hypothetical protein